MRVYVSLIAAIASAAAQGGAGLIDHPIAADGAPTYLDSDSWVASTPGLPSIRATVPGDLITDLQVAGLIGDPLYELNWQNSSLWDDHVWTYTKTFALGAAQLRALASGAGDTLLVFDVVKMAATVSVNGVAIGHTTIQFLRYEFSLAAAVRERGLVLAADNALTVEFDSKDQTTEGRWMSCTGGWVRAGGGADAAARRFDEDAFSLSCLPLTARRTGRPTRPPFPWARASLGQRPRAPFPRASGSPSTSSLSARRPSRTSCRTPSTRARTRRRR
jgi:hypothetical protein